MPRRLSERYWVVGGCYSASRYTAPCHLVAGSLACVEQSGCAGEKIFKIKQKVIS